MQLFLSAKSYLMDKLFDYQIGWTLLVSKIRRSSTPDEMYMNNSQKHSQQITSSDQQNNKEVSK